MQRLITRHGQIVRESDFVGGHLYPDGEPPLSDLGKEQAQLLGMRLRNEGFCGKILASPYMRTLETANIIAEITGLSVIPFAPIREIFRTEEQIRKYRGLTLEKMKEKYTRIDTQAELAYPWWTPDIESDEQVLLRVKDAVQLAESLYKDEDILFVGHGATAAALVSVYGIPKHKHPFLFNCALSYTDTEREVAVHCDLAHIPYEKSYSNFLSREEFDREYFNTPYDGEIEIPKEVFDIRATKLLHIGDTFSRDYPYYKRLIDEVKPDVIIHTGDIADEVKVGRKPHVRYEYKSKISYILGVLADSGARVIIVPGNNDVEDDVRELIPSATVCKRNTEITVDGVKCRVGHEAFFLTYDRKWSFFGHGPRGDEWEYSKNGTDGEYRFNACDDSYVVSVSEGKFYRIPTPKIER